MTHGSYIKCDICDKIYLLRISIGHSPKQIHAVECLECKTLLTIELDLEGGGFTYENCNSISGEVDEQECLVYNLHPELLIPKEFLHDRFYNINIHEGMRLVKEHKNSVHDEEQYRLTQEYTENLSKVVKNWNILKVAWKMDLNKKRQHYIDKQLKKYSSTTLDSNGASFEEILFDFNSTILFPSFLEQPYSFFRTVEAEIKTKNNEAELKNLNTYFDSSKDEYYKKVFDIYDLFFDFFYEYNQVLIYVTTSRELPLDFTVTSHNFEKTKKFYGDLYEAYTNNVTFLSLLHNVCQGRKFDQFNHIIFEKYLATDKAGRTQNFENTDDFAWYSEYVSSKLRNASHHGNINLDHTTVRYQAGKPLKSYAMSYTRFLEISMHLFMRFVSLTQLQILNNYMYNKKT